AGMSMKVYDYLKLSELEGCTIAIIMNAKSNKMGHKDIIKIECPLGSIDLDILGYIDHNITVDVISHDQIISKEKLSLPREIKNVIRCKNPRCITSIEQELDQVFVLTDPEHEVYRCKYCEEAYSGK
ncbi:MAG: aspartate carbamoyltransferase regulatory subunit, partial [Lachnospiraceae bacterium]|nr:aspartate carbamoyltransferase regulatory subunit [Lachnospiraceae bacterium]